MECGEEVESRKVCQIFRLGGSVQRSKARYMGWEVECLIGW